MAYIKNLQTFHFFLIIKDFTHYCAKGGFHRSSPDTADKKAIKTMTAAASKAARRIVLCKRGGGKGQGARGQIWLRPYCPTPPPICLAPTLQLAPHHQIFRYSYGPP